MRRGCGLIVAALLLVGPVVAGSAPASAAGNSWHITAQLALGTEDTALSCPLSKFCWAIEGGQRAFAVPARNEEPIAIACRGMSCIASDVSLAGNPIVLAGRA